MNFIKALFSGIVFYVILQAFATSTLKKIEDKGIEGISKRIVDNYKKRGMSDKEIINVTVKLYRIIKRWALVSALIFAILMFILK